MYRIQKSEMFSVQQMLHYVVATLTFTIGSFVLLLKIVTLKIPEVLFVSQVIMPCLVIWATPTNDIDSLQLELA